MVSVSISGAKNTSTFAKVLGLSKKEYTRPGIVAFSERSVKELLAAIPITKF